VRARRGGGRVRQAAVPGWTPRGRRSATLLRQEVFEVISPRWTPGVLKVGRLNRRRALASAAKPAELADKVLECWDRAFAMSRASLERRMPGDSAGSCRIFWAAKGEHARAVTRRPWATTARDSVTKEANPGQGCHAPGCADAGFRGGYRRMDGRNADRASSIGAALRYPPGRGGSALSQAFLVFARGGAAGAGGRRGGSR